LRNNYLQNFGEEAKPKAGICVTVKCQKFIVFVSVYEKIGVKPYVYNTSYHVNVSRALIKMFRIL